LACTGAGGQSQYRPGGGSGGAASGGAAGGSQASPGRPGGRPAGGIHCKENPINVFLSWELRGLSPNCHIHVSVSDYVYIPRIGPQICECRNWEAEHYNYIREIKVSFLGIYKWESAIYIGFSPALHLQCRQQLVRKKVVLLQNGGFCNGCITKRCFITQQMSHILIFFHHYFVIKDERNKRYIVVGNSLNDIGFLVKEKLGSTKSVE
jgi:hypothetical protein